MGAAWCRERAAKAQDSKSPFDRVIVKCVNQMSLSDSQGTPNSSQIQTSRQTKSAPNTHFEADSASGWHDVVLRVPDEAPVPPPRKKRQIKKEVLKLPPPPPPRTPSIHLEMDTPKFRPKSSLSLEVASPLSRQKSRSFTCLPAQIDQEIRDEVDLLRPQRSVSSMSNRSIATLSDATSERLDNYLKSCRSFGSLKPEELISELNQALQSDDSSDSDAWAGLDDWDLGIVDHHGASSGTPPLTPTSQLPARKGRKLAEFTVGEQPAPRKKVKSKKLPEASSKGNDPPANFQSNVKTSGGVKNTLIKPAQIPVQDFLRHSETSSLSEERRGSKLMVELSPSNSFTYDFTRGSLAPPRSPQIELPGTPSSPRSLSRCSTPLPPQCRDNCITPPSSPTEDATSSLLRLLNEYHAAAELIGDDDARKILQSLGIPEELTGDSEHSEELGDRHNADAEVEALVNQHPAAASPSSGRSSTNQSLAELETALSEYLEASQAKHPEGDDDEPVVTESAFAPIKQEPPQVKPRAKKSAKDVNPEITITTATDDKIETETKDNVGREKSESPFTPIRPPSGEPQEVEKKFVDEGRKETSEKTPHDVHINDARADEKSLFQPIKEDHPMTTQDVKPAIKIMIVTEDVGKEEDAIKASPTQLHNKPAFQVTD